MNLKYAVLNAQKKKAATAPPSYAYRLLYNFTDMAASKHIIIRIMRHNILNSALQDIAQLIYGVYFHVLVMPQPVQLGSVHMIPGI